MNATAVPVQSLCSPCHGSDGTGAFAGVPDLTRIKGYTKS